MVKVIREIIVSGSIESSTISKRVPVHHSLYACNHLRFTS